MKIYLAIGNTTKQRFDMFHDEGVKHVLISFASVATRWDPNLFPFEDILLDSGAFSVDKSGVKISLEAYTLWLQLYLDKLPQVKGYISLDVLGDPVQSQRNLEFMEAAGLKPLPVFHYGEDESVLKRLADKYPYVCLGGIAIGTLPSSTIKKFWDHVAVEFPDTKFHMLGFNAVHIFDRHQPYSIDSISWAAATAYGTIMGYRHGIPALLPLKEKDGYQHFFTNYEMYRNNIRAMMSYEKLEWLKNVKGPTDTGQGRLV